MNRFFVVRRKPNNSQAKQLIIVVGKNVSKKAVTRNTIKRRIRTLFAPLLKNKTVDYYVVVKKEALGAPYEDLRHEVMKL